jgi:hypothetical protein
LKMEGFKDVDLLSLLSLKTLRVLIIRYWPRIIVTQGRSWKYLVGIWPLNGASFLCWRDLEIP